MNLTSTLLCPSCNYAFTHANLTVDIYASCPNCSAYFNISKKNAFVKNQANVFTLNTICNIGDSLFIRNKEFICSSIAEYCQVDLENKYVWLVYYFYTAESELDYFLSQYNNHFVLYNSIPYEKSYSLKLKLNYNSKEFYRFDRSYYQAEAAIGTFDFDVFAEVKNRMFISPPNSIEIETIKEENYASFGEYIEQKEIQVNSTPVTALVDKPKGLVPTSPYSKAYQIFKDHVKWILLFNAFWLAFIIADNFSNPDQLIFRQTISPQYVKIIDTNNSTEPLRQQTSQSVLQNSDSILITKSFLLSDFRTNFELIINTNISYGWMVNEILLINDNTGEIRYCSSEIDFYSGYDSEGSWAEGSQNASLLLGNLPAGTYHFEIKPQYGTTMPITWHIWGYTGVSIYSNFILVALVSLLLLIVPYLIHLHRENKRNLLSSIL